MTDYLKGIKGCLTSKKFIMCSVILSSSIYLSVIDKMSPEFAAIVATIGTIYCYTVQKTETALNQWEQK